MIRQSVCLVGDTCNIPSLIQEANQLIRSKDKPSGMPEVVIFTVDSYNIMLEV